MTMAEQGDNNNNNNIIINDDDDVEMAVQQQAQSKEVVAHPVSRRTTTTTILESQDESTSVLLIHGARPATTTPSSSSSSSLSSSSLSHLMSTPATSTKQEGQAVEPCEEADVQATDTTTSSTTNEGDDCVSSTKVPKTVNHGEEVVASTIANGGHFENDKTSSQHSVRDDNDDTINNNQEAGDEKATSQVTSHDVDMEKLPLEDEERLMTTMTTPLPSNEPMEKSEKGCVTTTKGSEDDLARFKTFCVPRNDIPDDLLLEHALSAAASLKVVPTAPTITWRGEASTTTTFRSSRVATSHEETGECWSSSHPAASLAVAVAVAVPLALAIPDAVEYTPSTTNSRRTSPNNPLFWLHNRRRVHWYGALFGCALVGALTAGLVVFAILGRRQQQQQDLIRSVSGSGDGTALSTVAPTAYREARIQQQLQQLLLMGVGGMHTNETTTTPSTLAEPTSPWVLDPTTPLYHALHWILDHDPRHIDPDDPFLNQRFLLALFYFSTSQEGPWLSCNPVFTGSSIYYSSSSSSSSSSLSLETINSNTTNGSTNNTNRSNNDGDFCLFQALIDVFPHRYNSVPAYRWLTGQHECQWVGVQCDDFDRVKGLELRK
jgi:hypothetical protein